MILDNYTYKTIEFFLYNYNYIDLMIKNIIANKKDCEYNQSYTRYIKNKSSSLEDQVIRNIDLERRIFRLNKWKKLIKNILEGYKKSDDLKYSFIFMKYFQKDNNVEIENKLNITEQQRRNMKYEIINHIRSCAIKNNMLVEEVNVR